APGLMYRADGRRLFILPGVPTEMRGIFTEELAPEFLTGRTGGVVRELRFLFASAARFYPGMRQLGASHPDVSVGSCPNFRTKPLTRGFAGDDERRVLDAREIVRRRVAPMGLTPI